MGYPLEPLSDMRDKGDGTVKVIRDFSLVDMIGQGVRNQVVFQVLDVVLGRWFCSCAGISTDSKDCRRGFDVFQ